MTTLNCKAGDLARVILHPETVKQGYVDKILRVSQLIQHPRNGTPCWMYEGPLLRCQCGCGGVSIALADSILRPIRDPGDDATDEMLELLGKPVREGETV